jgi:hypothetical protein
MDLGYDSEAIRRRLRDRGLGTMIYGNRIRRPFSASSSPSLYWCGCRCAECPLFLAQGGDELAAEVGEVGNNAAPDEVRYSHVVVGLREGAATAMADSLP